VATGGLLGRNEFAVDGDLEDSTARGLYHEVRDFLLELFEDLGRQTDGSRSVASFSAVLDPYLHRSSLRVGLGTTGKPNQYIEPRKDFGMARRASNEEVNALRQEQRDEVEGTMVGAGNVGPFTKGMNRGMAAWVPLWTGIGALIGLAVGLALGGGGWLVVTLIVGAFAGATFGFSAGGFVGSRRRGEGDAAMDDPSVVRKQTSPDPIRLDEHDGSAPEAPSSKEAQRLVRE
jgi:hypothetical protein